MTDFPMDAAIFNKIVEVFNQTRSYILLLFPLAFFIRIAFGFILLKADSFTDILKDSLFLFLGLFFFMDILKLTLQIPYFVASELSFGEWRSVNMGEGLFTKFVKRIVDWIGILSYWISFGLYVVIVSILGFFAGYILFLGTMFRAYGMLKVFFILLFVVSLWPLLWHSINFAVYTIAVSDNALANNVIIGGASVAKVMLPLWLISKTSKMPLSQSLKKISYFGGGLAGAAGSGAYSLGSGAYSYAKEKTENIFQREDSSEEYNAEAVINISQTDETRDEEGFTSGGENCIDKDDFFKDEVKQGRDESEKLPEGNQPIAGNGEKPKEENTLLQEHHQENKILQEHSVLQENIQENHIENTNQTSIQNQMTKEVSSSSNSQVITERKDFIPESSFNENSLNENSLTETKYQTPPENIETPPVEQKSIEFNESIHQESWIEEEENTHSKPENEKETEL